MGGFFGAGGRALELVMRVAQLDEYIKIHWIVHFKVVSSMVCEVYLNKNKINPGDQISSNLPTISGGPSSQTSVWKILFLKSSSPLTLTFLTICAKIMGFSSCELSLVKSVMKHISKIGRSLLEQIRIEIILSFSSVCTGPQCKLGYWLWLTFQDSENLCMGLPLSDLCPRIVHCCC